MEKITNQASVYLPSELIINSDGSVYHLALRPEQLADTVILVGDPDRVARVSAHFDRIEHKVQNREFVTHTGWIGSKRISCLSHGIGCDNIDIVLNEIDALAAINLKERVNLDHPRSLDLIRIGTSGALSPDVPVDSWVVSNWAIGLDGLLNYYPYAKSAEQMNMEALFIENTGYPSELCRPYAFKADEGFAQLFANKCIPGITLTAPGFYAPQGRVLRWGAKHTDLIQRFEQFCNAGLSVTNFEMETSAIYGMAHLGGHRACTVCGIIANRYNKTYSESPADTVDKLIKFVLEKVCHARI
jgi:uridine phosphorylase